ncbi:uncharacterized protein LOC143294804 isoform X3 [Babylonia areolata]|uniref:uncharacterized protein LOC143294804 isoform X1 n=1 Tax=Babylonia areolata TaxID=304850 RepID=UPI003FD1F3BD
MKWRKALTVLASRKKIDSAAIFDLQGRLLSRTENFAEKQEHVDSVLHALAAPSSSPLQLLKLRVFGDVFTCLAPGPAGILLAKADHRLFTAAVASPYCVVIAFAKQGARGSCLYEVTEFCKLLESKVCPRLSSSHPHRATSTPTPATSFQSHTHEESDTSTENSEVIENGQRIENSVEIEVVRE